MKSTKIICLLFCITYITSAQPITWKNISTNFNLPNGIQVFEGSRQSPSLKIYYADADLNDSNLAVRPYLSGTNFSVDSFNDKVGAYVSINGGFFGGNVSYSTVVYPNEVKATNVTTLSRNSKTYPVIRSMFSMKTDRTFSVDWIYHFGNTINDIYKFNLPLQYLNNDPNPLPAPLQSNGEKITNLLTAIGGAPVLVKNGVINISYNEEIMWGSGVGFDNRDPRTAVGYKNNKHVIFLVADGRSQNSEGLSLPELAQLMLDLGCYEAINLDGGGSTQMAIGKSYVNSPAGIRPVPAIFSIVHSDSLKVSSSPTFEKIIDTEDNSVSKTSGWFESANSGFYGTSKTLLVSKGSGTNFIRYRLNLPAEKKYDVYAWWVSASNRCVDSPYIISHKTKEDTILVDQTKNGSSWQKLGTFTFTADTNSFVKISDKAKTGTYVAADAIKIVSYESITEVSNTLAKLPAEIKLFQNYPNPFNPTTVIRYKVQAASYVTLKVFDMLGREITTLVNELKQVGTYSVRFNVETPYMVSLPSGVYFYQLKVVNPSIGSGESFIQTKKMILTK
jgi:hypothetical protein